jgi:hypothetical protein
MKMTKENIIDMKKRHIRVAFFEGSKNKFLYQIRMPTPTNSQDLLEIIDSCKKELFEIRDLLLSRKKIAEIIAFDNSLKLKNFDFGQPFFEIRNLSSRI